MGKIIRPKQHCSKYEDEFAAFWDAIEFVDNLKNADFLKTNLRVIFAPHLVYLKKSVERWGHSKDKEALEKALKTIIYLYEKQFNLWKYEKQFDLWIKGKNE